MDQKILLAYASVHGATREIAEFVAQAMRETGLEVDLQPLRSVRSLTGYKAVVIGAPLYILRWHKDARGFLSRYQAELTRLPVAVFGSGPFGKGDEDEWNTVRQQLDKELEKLPWFKPVSVEVFGGRFDPAHLRLPWSLLPALKQIPANDLREWPAIRSWAAGLAGRFDLLRQGNPVSLTPPVGTVIQK